MKKFILLVLGALFFFILGGAFFSRNTTSIQNSPTPIVEGAVATPSPEAPKEDLVKVSRVVDGDTIEIVGGKKVRLIGIDTPELNKSGATGCFGREAYDYLDELLDGKSVRLEKDVSETDKYGRFLRFVYLEDVFVNDKLVRDGYARVYTYPPDVKYQDQFRESEKLARENNLGLWKMCSVPAKPAELPAQSAVSGGTYSCNCSKPCTEISSCAEAQYQLKTCGCSKRDGDGDGIACDGAPLHCQN